MFKKMIINWVIELVFDEMIKALRKAAHRSSSKVDDKLVRTIADNRVDLIKDIKSAI